MLPHLNLIHLFGFYLAMMFLISTYRRIGQYRDVLQLLLTGPARWPKLLRLIQQQRSIVLKGTVLLPGLIALILCGIHFIASRLIWPQANITLSDLAAEWWMWPILALVGLGMLGIDGFFVIRVSSLDRQELEKYLDQAEHWLTTWKAPVLKFVTFGWINPHEMVNTEVRKALEGVSQLLGQTLWWVAIQAGLRVLFGLALWLSWALHPSLR